MKLSEAKIRNLKPKNKAYKMGDGDGLYIFVKPTGRKYWRMKYFYENKEKVLSIGVYPEISLAEAREKRFEVRKMKANGVDPATAIREQKQQKSIESSNSFQSVALEWHENRVSSWTPYYAKQLKQRLEKDVFPKIGHRPISAITAKEILQMAQAIEERNAYDIAHRAVQICGQIFQYAIITDRAEDNPAPALRGALKTRPQTHHAYLGANELPAFMEKLETYDGGIQTKLAIKLILLTFVRTTELRAAKWSEIDFDSNEWRIPAERMKMRMPHIVPLSSQAVKIFNTLKKLNGQREHVFPSAQSPHKCMSNNTMLFALYAMGYKKRATVHGFRATASTVLNESDLFGRDVIERQLAHQERSRVRAAYDHAEHLPARRKMMQWWGDYVDGVLAQSQVK